MITATQAARALGLKAVTIRMLCRQGQIQGAVKFGQAWMIPWPPKYIRRRGPGRPPTRRDE